MYNKFGDKDAGFLLDLFSAL